jgi:hypothetical protein
MNIDLKKLGHIYFFLLFIGSLVFYKERTLYMDCACHIISVINAKSFAIASNRYSVIIPEFIPLMLIKLKAPLPIVLITFSLSYTLLYYIIYLICTYTFKVSYIIIPIMLTLSVFSTQSYFHIVTETHQGLMYTILLFAWVSYYNKFIGNRPFLFFIATLFFIILAFFAHPVTLFPIIFILGFFLLNEWKNSSNNRVSLALKYGSIFLITFLAYLLRVRLTPNASYDGQFYTQLKENLSLSFFDLYPLKFAYSKFGLYVLPVIMFFLLLFFYVRRKEIPGLIYFVISFLLFLIIVQLSFGQGDSDVMMEKNYMPFAIFIGIPLTYFLMNTTINWEKSIIIYLVLGATIFGITNETIFSKHLGKRIDFYGELSSFAKEKNIRKLLLSDSCAPNPAINWAIGAETLLYSSLHGKENSMTAYLNNKDTSHLSDNNLYLFVPFWKYLNEGDLNSTYFDLGHQKYINVSCSCGSCLTPHSYFISPSAKL